MNAKQILMHGRSIENLLAGRKTQTRRMVKGELAQAIEWIGGRVDDEPTTSDDIRLRWQEHIDEDTGRAGGPEWCAASAEYPEEGVIPLGKGYGNVGDLLYVREAWNLNPRGNVPIYRQEHPKACARWRPSIHMPRWASRITLHLTDVRVERVQEITKADALAEGIEHRDGYYMGALHPVKGTHKCEPTAVEAFRGLWNDTNGPGAWDRKDWCWVLCFDVIHANVDAVLADPARYGLKEAA